MDDSLIYGLSRRPGSKEQIWAKCSCGKGKWSYKKNLEADGITTKNRCHRCASLTHADKAANKIPYHKKMTKEGYMTIWVPIEDSYCMYPKHTRKPKYGWYVAEHRYVLAKFLNRRLYPYENVHHKNGIRDDNKIENLELWTKPHPTGQRIADKISEYLNAMTEDEVVNIIRNTQHKNLVQDATYPC